MFSVLKVKYSSFSSIAESLNESISGDITFPNFSGDAVATATVGREELLSKAICTEVTECGSKIISKSSCNDVISVLIMSSENVTEEKICFMVRESNFQGSANFSLIKNLDCILICVPTPLTANREPDMSYIISTARNIAPHLTKEQLVVLESTTYPGTSQEILAKTLEAVSGLKPDSDF